MNRPADPAPVQASSLTGAAPVAHARGRDTSTASCPLCGGPNACSMACQASSGDPSPCWCTQAVFPPELLARLAPQDQGMRCICRNCLQSATALVP